MLAEEDVDRAMIRSCVDLAAELGLNELRAALVAFGRCTSTSSRLSSAPGTPIERLAAGAASLTKSLGRSPVAPPVPPPGEGPFIFTDLGLITLPEPGPDGKRQFDISVRSSPRGKSCRSRWRCRVRRREGRRVVCRSTSISTSSELP